MSVHVFITQSNYSKTYTYMVTLVTGLFLYLYKGFTVLQKKYKDGSVMMGTSLHL